MRIEYPVIQKALGLLISRSNAAPKPANLRQQPPAVEHTVHTARTDGDGTHQFDKNLGWLRCISS